MSKNNAYKILNEHLKREFVLNEFFFLYFGSKMRLPSGRIIHRHYTLEPSDNPATVVRRWIVGEASLKANTREVIARNYLALQDLEMYHKKRDLEERERKELYRKAVSVGLHYLDRARSASGGERRILDKILRIKEKITNLINSSAGGFGSHFDLNKLSYKAKYYDTDYIRSI